MNAKQGRIRILVLAIVVSVVVVVAVVAVVSSLWLRSSTPAPPSSSQELFDSLESSRPFELRWPGAPGYAPCLPSGIPGLCQRSLSENDRDLLRETLRARDPSQDLRERHVAEIARLFLSPDRPGLLRARQNLEALASRAPENPELRAHLAIVTSVLATLRAEPWDQIRALSLWLGTLGDKEQREEGLFNLALLLQSLGLEKQAQKAWAELLAYDPYSSWAVEAKHHLEQLQSPTQAQIWEEARSHLLGRHVQDREIRAWVEAAPRQAHDNLRDELLTAWISDWSPYTPPWEETPHSISNFPRLAAQLASHTGDPLLQEALASLRQSTPGDVPRIRQALGHFRVARNAYRGGNCKAASEGLSAALPVLTKAASPLTGWIRTYLAFCRLGTDLPAGRSELTLLAGEIDGQAYPLLAGEIQRMLGIAAGRQEEPTRAMEHYGRAIELWTTAWGQGSSSSLFLLRGEMSSLLGHRNSAWKDLTRSLRGLSRAGDPRGLHSALVVSGSMLLDLQLPRVALQFREEAVLNAEVWGAPYPLARSYWQRGLVHGALGQRSQALLDVVKGKSLAGEIEDPVSRAAMENALALEEAIARIEDSPALAGAQLQKCRKTYQEAGHRNLALRASLYEARTHFALGDLEAGERLLDQALLSFEEYLAESTLAEPRLVIEAEEAFDQTIELRIEKGESREALLIAEQSRYLPQEGFRASPGIEPPLDHLPEGVVFLFFQDVGDHILRWSIRKEGISHDTITTEPRELVRLSGLHSWERGPLPSFSTLASSLHDLLIGNALDGASTHRLVVVPDRSTAWVPFALLRSDRGLLIEQVEIVYAPSLAHATRRTERGSGTILAVGSPSGATTAAAGLAPLAQAEAEARTIAGLYSESRSLLGAEATPKAFLETAHGAGTIHFAGHSSSDPFLPYRSFLHLAADPTHPEGEMDAASLAAVDLSGTGLVILSSCASATDFSHRHRSSFGLANAFLAAGVGAVIGAQWQVDDSATYELMLTLHRELAAGIPPATALRKTQLTFLASSDPRSHDTRTWAAFRLVGSALP